MEGLQPPDKYDHPTLIPVYHYLIRPLDNSYLLTFLTLTI